ncbi:hypothetical protein ACF1DV_08325 [Streptomyces achromogenes]|uniref:hypothetical protein n=1 Tax=Streptomyces achromogenes TaxID=67255 RepID=UPI0036FC1E8A
MAYVQERKRSDGEVSYIVRWRAGGARAGKNESEIFTAPVAAERFRDLVNGHGQQWPPGWIRGHGFVSDLRSPEEMFEPFAMKQIGLLTGVQGDTKAKYRRLVEQNMSPWFKSCSVRDGEGGITREMVQQWVNDLAAGAPAPHDEKDRKPRTKYKPKTVANQHGLLHAILQAAVDAEPQLRATNPCSYTPAAPPGWRRGRGGDGLPRTRGVGVDPRVHGRGREGTRRDLRGDRRSLG